MVYFATLTEVIVTEVSGVAQGEWYFPEAGGPVPIWKEGRQEINSFTE